MKRRIFSSVLAVIMIFSVTVFAASADSAVDLTGLTASDSTVNFHINEIYSKIDVLEYELSDVSYESLEDFLTNDVDYSYIPFYLCILTFIV